MLPRLAIIDFLFDTFKRTKFKNDSIESRLVGYQSFRQIFHLIPVWNFNHHAPPSNSGTGVPTSISASTTTTSTTTTMMMTTAAALSLTMSPAMVSTTSSLLSSSPTTQSRSLPAAMKEKTLGLGGAEKIVLTPDSSLVDRIYAHCLGKTNGSIDFSAVVGVLSTICKGTASEKLRFFFDLHDIDGDGLLSRDELTSVMDSLLWLFEGAEDEEACYSAISAFVQAAYRSNSGSTGDRDETGGKEEEEEEEGGEKETNGVVVVVAEPGQQQQQQQQQQQAAASEFVRVSFYQFYLNVLAQPPLLQFFSTKINLVKGEED